MVASLDTRPMAPSSRIVNAIWILCVLLLVFPDAADARKRRKGKAKRKRPAATAPVKQQTPPPVVEEPELEPEADAEALPETAVGYSADQQVEQPAPATQDETSPELAADSFAATDSAHEDVQPTLEDDEATRHSAASFADEVPAQAEPKDGGWRIRAGVNGGVLMFFPGPGYGGNVSVRAGVRMSDLLAAYIDAGSGFGIGGSGSASESGLSLSMNLASYWRVGVMGEAKLGPLFLALGPALFRGSWAGVGVSADSSGGGQTAYGASGFFPAGLSRIGVSFGKRNKFTLGLEGMLVIGKVTEVAQSGGTEGAEQSVSVGKSTLAFSPAVIFGWDLN